MPFIKRILEKVSLMLNITLLLSIIIFSILPLIFLLFASFIPNNLLDNGLKITDLKYFTFANYKSNFISNEFQRGCRTNNLFFYTR